MKKLLYINQVSNYLSEGIVNAMLGCGGYDEVTLLLGNPDNVHFNDLRVKLDTICAYDRSSFIKRTKSWIISTAQILWKLWTKYRKYDVFLVSNPPTAAFTMAFSRNRYKSLIYDIYPDGLVSGGFLSMNNPFIRLWAWYNKRFFKKAERVFTITDGMADRLSKYVDKTKIEVVPIWYNPALRRIDKADNEFIKQQNLEGKFIVMYSGNIGKTHNVELLVDVAELMKEDEDIVFVIIGEGWAKKRIAEKIGHLKLTNIHLLTYQPLNFISHSLSSADLSYVSLDEQISTVSVPSKIYNSLFVGSPLICIASEKAELTRIVNKYNVGKCFADINALQIAEYITELKKDTAKYDELRNNTIQLSEAYTYLNAEKFC